MADKKQWALISFALGVFPAVIVSVPIVVHDIRKRAVDHGAAHWEVDKYGEASFHWNKEKPDGHD